MWSQANPISYKRVNINRVSWIVVFLLVLSTFSAITAEVPASANTTSPSMLTICKSLKTSYQYIAKSNNCNNKIYETIKWYRSGNVPIGLPNSRLLTLNSCQSKLNPTNIVLRAKCNRSSEVSIIWNRRVGPPDSPVITNVESSEFGTATIRFTAPANDGGAAVTSFTAVAIPGNIKAVTKVVNSGNITIKGLVAGTRYTFKVFASNLYGNSNESVGSSSIYIPNVPGAPLIKSVEVKGSYSAEIAFAKPDSDGGAPITEYKVFSTPSAALSHYESGEGLIQVNGLNPGTSYVFTIVAFNTAGDSVASNESNKVTTANLAPVSASAPDPAPVISGGGGGGGGGGGAPAVTYTITYALNGGSGSLPTQANVSTGGTFTTAASTGITKSGYTFNGWSDGSTTTAESATYTVGSSNVTLIAQWSAVSHTITYALNGGSGSLPTQANISTGGTFTTAVSTGITKSGYTFGGWSDGSTTTAESTTYTVGSSNVTLTAQWISAPTVDSLDVTSGRVIGGTAVIITGTGFLAGATVKFGSDTATVGVITSTTISVTTPSHLAGSVTVLVTNPDTGSGSKSSAFTYFQPTLVSINVPSGSVAGGTRVVITGTHLLGVNSVTFLGVRATIISNTDTTLTVDTPARSNAIGAFISASWTDGSDVFLYGAYTYTAGPAAKVAITRASVGNQDGAVFTTQPQVTVQDANGNTITSSTATVTASVSSGGTLIGTSTANASGGVATFNNLGISGTINSTYTVTYTAVGLTPASVDITVTPNSGATFTSYSFAGLTPAVSAQISVSWHEVRVTIPYEVDRTNLVATFTLDRGATATKGGVAQVSGTTANSFAITTSVASNTHYVVTAQDGVTTMNWNVIVTIGGLTPSFSTYTRTLDGFTAQISNYDSAYTWAGTATAGGSVSISNTGLITVTGLAANTSSIATITTSRTSVSPNPTYTSGSASTAATSSLPVYGVGQVGLGGGTIFYAAATAFAAPGAPCNTNGAGGTSTCKYLEYAPAVYLNSVKQNDGTYGWSSNTSTLTGQVISPTTNQDIGQGFNNTSLMKVNGATSAAQAYVLQYAGTDSSAGQWFIPSLKELNQLCRYVGGYSIDNSNDNCGSSGLTQTAINEGFRNSGVYWSSSESNAGNAWVLVIGGAGGSNPNFSKNNQQYIRPVRVFGDNG